MLGLIRADKRNVARPVRPAGLPAEQRKLRRVKPSRQMRALQAGRNRVLARFSREGRGEEREKPRQRPTRDAWRRVSMNNAGVLGEPVGYGEQVQRGNGELTACFDRQVVKKTG